ncbi:hypothetical protein ACJX0J_033974, partial [Zea mays]
DQLAHQQWWNLLFTVAFYMWSATRKNKYMLARWNIILLGFGRFDLQDGEQIRFWDDIWLGARALKIQKHTSVAEVAEWQHICAILQPIQLI